MARTLDQDTLAEKLFAKFWRRYDAEERRNLKLKAFVKEIWITIYYSPLRPHLLGQNLDGYR